MMVMRRPRMMEGEDEEGKFVFLKDRCFTRFGNLLTFSVVATDSLYIKKIYRLHIFYLILSWWWKSSHYLRHTLSVSFHISSLLSFSHLIHSHICYIYIGLKYRKSENH